MNEKDHLPERWSWSVPSTLVVNSMLPPGQVGNQVGWAMFPNSLDFLECYYFGSVKKALTSMFLCCFKKKKKETLHKKCIYTMFIVHP